MGILPSQALTVFSIEDGFWGEPTTWSNNEVPDYFTDTVIVLHLVELDQDIYLEGNMLIVDDDGIICSNFYGIEVGYGAELKNFGIVNVNFINIYGVATNNGEVTTTNVYVYDKKKGENGVYNDNGSTDIVHVMEGACPEIEPEPIDSVSNIVKEVINIKEDSLEICYGENPEYPYSKGKYVWSNGAVNSDFKPKESGLYYVDIVSKLDGTRNRDSIYITVISSALSIPNIFTPNGDNTNENFLKEDFELVELSIYNRWGKLVSRQEEVNNSFENVSDGTYYYVIHHHSKCIELNPIKGWVDIRR